MLIVADSSALIALATCDGLDVVLRVYDDIKVPEAVYAEIVAPEKPQSDSLGSFLSGRVVKVDTTRWVLAAGLDAARSKPWRSTSSFPQMHC